MNVNLFSLYFFNVAWGTPKIVRMACILFCWAVPPRPSSQPLPAPPDSSLASTKPFRGPSTPRADLAPPQHPRDGSQPLGLALESPHGLALPQASQRSRLPKLEAFGQGPPAPLYLDHLPSISLSRFPSPPRLGQPPPSPRLPQHLRHPHSRTYLFVLPTRLSL